MEINNYIVYLIKINLILMIIYAVYRLLLHKSGLHRLNRYFIITIPIVSLLIPVLNIGMEGTNLLLEDFVTADFQNFSVDEVIKSPKNLSASSGSITSFLFLIYLAGLSVFLFRFILQLSYIIKLKRNSLNKKEGHYTYILTKQNHSFSFFYWVFLPLSNNPRVENEIIIEHEKVHAKEKHSLDLLWMELVHLIFWYNPVFFNIKKSLKETHEFIVDKKLLSGNIDLGSYLKTLFIEIEDRILPDMANPFRSKSIKNRIKMIDAKKATLVSRLSYFILVPILFFLIQSFAPGNSEDSIPSIKPLEGAVVSLEYGYEGPNPVTNKHMHHKGIDLKAELGTDVVATGNGKVIEASENKGWGKLIIIEHGGQYQTYYAHLNDFSVKQGDKVVKGQVIGHVGSTGYSTGPHLHYEVRKDGINENPSLYFK